MIKRAAWALLVLLVLGAVGFYAEGGRTGLLLLVVKHVLRKEYGPPREVAWQAGFAVPAPAATPGGGSPPRRRPDFEARHSPRGSGQSECSI